MMYLVFFSSFLHDQRLMVVGNDSFCLSYAYLILLLIFVFGSMKNAVVCDAMIGDLRGTKLQFSSPMPGYT
jgi:hypothetical protein